MPKCLRFLKSGGILLIGFAWQSTQQYPNQVEECQPFLKDYRSALGRILRRAQTMSRMWHLAAAHNGYQLGACWRNAVLWHQKQSPPIGREQGRLNGSGLAGRCRYQHQPCNWASLCGLGQRVLSNTGFRSLLAAKRWQKIEKQGSKAGECWKIVLYMRMVDNSRL